VLFADDFSDGSLAAPVSINAPDPLGNPETIFDNLSITGNVRSQFGPDQRAYAGDNSGPGITGGEVGGIASWAPAGGGTNSGTFITTYNFANSPFVTGSGQMTVYLDDLDPINGGGGTSGNFVGLGLFRPIGGNGGGVDVNQASVGIGFLIRDNGLLQVFGNGTVLFSNVEFDANPSDQTYDVRAEITNISGFGPGNSFDFELFIDDVSIVNGTRTGVDTSLAHIGIETRTGSSSLSRFAVTSVPEPTTMVGIVVGMAGVIAAVRRRK
jgi:hypothetical protein